MRCSLNKQIKKYMKEQANKSLKKEDSNQNLIEKDVKFEHYERACCRVLGNPKTFPTPLREEVLERVKHM